MSEKVLKMLLGEIRTIRVICQTCETVVEMPVEKLADRFSESACRFCKSEFKAPGKADPFKELTHAFKAFEILSDSVQIELIVPEPERTSA